MNALRCREASSPRGMSATSVWIISASPRQLSTYVGSPLPRDRAKGFCLTKEKIAKIRFANARGAG